MPDIGLCFKATWDYLNDLTEVNYQRVIEAIKKAKSIDGGKEIRMPLSGGD